MATEVLLIPRGWSYEIKMYRSGHTRRETAKQFSCIGLNHDVLFEVEQKQLPLVEADVETARIEVATQ